MNDFGWGQSGDVQPGTGNFSLSAQCDFPFAGVFTIQFSVQGVPADKAFHCVAFIQWSVNGQTVTRRVSVNNGTTVSGCGSAVKVYVYDDGQPPPAAGWATDPYLVSINIVPGVRPQIQQPATYSPMTTDSGNTFPGAIIVPATSNRGILVPRDAGAISLFTTVGDFSGTPVILTEASVQVQQNGASITRVYDPRQPVWVPLIDSIFQLEFINTTAKDLLFSFTYGIDG